MGKETLYFYHPSTDEYTGKKEIETKFYGSNVSYSTKKTPLPLKEGFSICFNKTKDSWEYRVDNRGNVVYSTFNKEEIVVSYIGEIKEGFTLLKPSEFDIWNKTAWEIDLDSLRISKKSEINKDCKASIILGFKSSATGVERLYESDEKDQLNLIGAVATGIRQNIKCSTDNGKTWEWIDHLATELKQLMKDGAATKAKYLEKAALLKYQILTASQEQLEQIKW